MRETFQYCEALLRQADKDRFLAALFAPAEVRGALHALYAFSLETARVREAVTEPLAGEIRLQWWREAIAGERAAEARGHPVASALLDVIGRYELPRARLAELIEARRFDLGSEPMGSVTQCEEYCRATSSILVELAARVLDPDATPAEHRFADPAGISIAIAGLLRAFPLHAARGQLFIPGEVLARHDVDPQQIRMGRSGAGLAAALATMRGRAALHYQAARTLIAHAPAAVMPAWLPVALVPQYLRALGGNRNDPFRPAHVPQWQRQWTLWRAARSGRLGES